MFFIQEKFHKNLKTLVIKNKTKVNIFNFFIFGISLKCEFLFLYKKKFSKKKIIVFQIKAY